MAQDVGRHPNGEPQNKRKREDHEHHGSAVIIGAGTVGLSTALVLKRTFPTLDVTIVAECFYAQTTSFGSGGYWMPYAINDDDRVVGWGKDSYDHFLSVLNSADGAKAGIQMLPSYQLYPTSQELPTLSWRDAVMGYRLLNSDEIQRLLGPANTIYQAGYTFTTVVADQKYYMTYLTEELKRLGVKFVQKKVDSLFSAEIDHLGVDSGSDVGDDSGGGVDSPVRIVINCCGLNGDTVCQVNDDHSTTAAASSSSSSSAAATTSYPIRGQVIRVKAPWIRAVWGFGTSYIIPNMDNVVLGGTAQRHDHNLIPTLQDSETIMEDICKLFPSLHHAVQDNVWVGLRPGRDRIRCEGLVVNEHKMIAHCYGHGGSGITLAYGCARDLVTNYIQPFLEKISKTKKI